MRNVELHGCTTAKSPVVGDLCHLRARACSPTFAPTLLIHSRQSAVTASVSDREDIRGSRRSVQFLKDEDSATNRSTLGKFPGTVHPTKRNTIMKLSKLTLAVIAATTFGTAFAQSTSQVTLFGASQNQSGALNSQTANIGNASGSGRSNVTVFGASQNQSGALNSQTANIGNASGAGRSTVTVFGTSQNQSGALNAQRLNVGNAAGAGVSNVTAFGTSQNQSGALNSQTMNLGNASGAGRSNVTS